MSPDYEYLVNHIFLPPRLPQRDDARLECDSDLIEMLSQSLRAYMKAVSPHRSIWIPCVKMLERLVEIRTPNGSILTGKLQKMLHEMTDRDVLAIHIRSQNAGLIIRRCSDEYFFEAFELSPSQEAVVNTQGRMIRTFPGPAVAVSANRINEKAFVEPLVEMLAKLDAEVLEEAIPTTKKAGSIIRESRDTAHPRFVTQLLTQILLAVGRRLDVKRIQKRTRDDVLWKDAYKPWRRSPLWLLLRVALQTSTTGGKESSDAEYKRFMVFFMSKILSSGLEAALPSSFLSIMLSKIARRALKLIKAKNETWKYVESVVNSSRAELARRWSKIEDRRKTLQPIPMWEESGLACEKDLALQLKSLQPHLKGVRSRLSLEKSLRKFDPDIKHRIQISRSALPSLDLEAVSRNDALVRLMDFESWMRHNLDIWATSNTLEAEDCDQMAKLIREYISSASVIYKGDPMQFSLMVLTTMEMWRAFDEAATRGEPILMQYSLQIPLATFQPLLLPHKSHMQRLWRLEEWLVTREASTRTDSSSIFGKHTHSSLPVRFFDQSEKHQTLREDVQDSAGRQSLEKRQELEEKRQKYAQTMGQADRLQHEEHQYFKKGKLRTCHSYKCQKCALESTAESMTIDVHEWPLPANDLAAKVAVFELAVPPIIQTWRHTLYHLHFHLLSNATSSKQNRSAPACALRDYSGLRHHNTTSKDRLQPASMTKSFISSHYRSKNVSSADEGSILVNNGLSYELFDTEKGVWTADLPLKCDLKGPCTLKLSPGQYHNLQFAVDSTEHTPNEVVSRQSECAETLGVHEYYAFGMLRCGHQLQWRNVALAIAAKSLNFYREEVGCLLLQAAWQVGPADGSSLTRESHFDLTEQEFGHSLIAVIEKAFSAVEGSWQGAAAARTFSMIASRLMSLTPFIAIKDKCIGFLGRVRQNALRWMRDVARELRAAANDSSLEELRKKMLEMSLTCHLTFDVEDGYITKVLSGKDDVKVLIECMLEICNQRPLKSEICTTSIRHCLDKSYRLSHSHEPHLRAMILEDPAGIDQAITQIWPAYHASNKWNLADRSHNKYPEWISSQVMSLGRRSMTVHFNLLNGTLLVDGLPLTRLPPSFETHKSFQRLFGRKVFDVMPSTSSEMEFEAKDSYQSQRIHFRMQGTELIIRACLGKKIWEYIPEYALGKDFPTLLRHEYAHWLDLSNFNVEFRPLSDIWTSKIQNMTLELQSNGRYIARHGSNVLLDRYSQHANLVSRVLEPLEKDEYLHVFYDYGRSKLQVLLPRFKLDFFQSRQSSDLESKQFRDMIIDPDQSFGTLTGLENKLTLRAKTGTSRIVLIPHGDVEYQKNDNHVSVQIKSSDRDLRLHVFRVDTILGRLIDSGNLLSKLFRCYLHALTSHCIVDRLTGRTGTEEALTILKSPAIRSFPSPSAEEFELLTKIARLSPCRAFYPNHLRVMQTVTWNKLPSLSQHSSFSDIATQIVQEIRTHRHIYNLPDQLPELESHGSQQLKERAKIREAAFHIDDFGAEHHTRVLDREYIARDYLVESSRELEAYKIACLVECWDSQECHKNLWQEYSAWGSIIHGPREEALVVGYDASWLQPYKSHLSEKWLTMQTMMSKCNQSTDKYRIMFFLATLSYSQKVKQELVRTLLAFATNTKLRSMKLPAYDSYQLSDGFEAREEDIQGVFETHYKEFDPDLESDLSLLPDETYDAMIIRREKIHSEARREDIGKLSKALHGQWPTDRPVAPASNGNARIGQVDFKRAMTEVQEKFQSWCRNAQLYSFTKQAIEVFDSLNPQIKVKKAHKPPAVRPEYYPQRAHIDLGTLFDKAPPKFESFRIDTQAWITQNHCAGESELKINELLDRILQSSSTEHERCYAFDLAESIRALPKADKALSLIDKHTLELAVKRHVADSERKFAQIHRNMTDLLRKDCAASKRIASAAGMTPRLSTSSLLSYLLMFSQHAHREDWKKVLIGYGMVLAGWQQSIRFLRHLENDSEFIKEVQACSSREWEPLEYPGWLVFEIENDISIRPDQIRIAREIMFPSSQSNSVLQLNMGEGKTSVIVPLVAWALADGKQLTRVMVLKPLAQQMLDLLIQKLSGLLGRKIWQMPFSRSIDIDIHRAEQIRSACQECMNTGGVMLVQPEHVQSFELIGIERFLSGQTELGKSLIDTQIWLDGISRDILDESDEILNARSELVYTVGPQQPIDMSPDRWTIIRDVLDLVHKCSLTVNTQLPNALELVGTRKGSFPRLRMLQTSAEKEIMRQVASEIIDAGLEGLPTWTFSSDLRSSLHSFLLSPYKPSSNESLRDQIKDNLMWNKLLLLKGLIGNGLLGFAFGKKRWRVNYGLDLSRSLLAVPYHAKDTPALTAEFSHPDITIVLTSLSYYYGGLNELQLKTSFEKLLKSDDAEEEFGAWLQQADEPPAFMRNLASVNLADAIEFSETVFPCFRYAKKVIDFFLRQVVFPAEMREFESKLSSSGWDISRQKTKFSTGFSGTNDSKAILPLSIQQKDLPSQKSTNARVIEWILQGENSYMPIFKESTAQSFGAKSLLEAVHTSRPSIRVVIDVGAQMLEWTNRQFAEVWLDSISSDMAQAAVFFDETNQLSVIHRDGLVEPLAMSPFASQMDQCLIFLDESHTRGTDLKLPKTYRAAVTLGPLLTKDRLAQACMRMRQLGRGQSVVFLGPPEVERDIMELSGKKEADEIRVIDILQWSISQTCGSMKELVPLWAAQGLRRQRHEVIWSQMVRNQHKDTDINIFRALLDPEAETIEERYGTADLKREERIILGDFEDDITRLRDSQVQEIRSKCKQFGLISMQSAALNEEQERELSPEIERERELQRPPHCTPCRHSLSPEITDFARDGLANLESSAFIPAFDTFLRTSAKSHFENGSWPSDVLVTKDFAQTVNMSKTQLQDNYLRPANWILRSKIRGDWPMIVISPFEAQQLLPIVRGGGNSSMHLYGARAKRLATGFNDLDFCTISGAGQSAVPALQLQHLDLFAGQLYLTSLDAYHLLCGFLGILTKPPSAPVQVSRDGFAPLQSRQQLGMDKRSCPFQTSPVPFLRAVLSMRAKGQVFRQSHLGKILNGELLREGDF